MTLEQALALTYRQEIHAGRCTVTIGPRGGTKDKREVWRVNGAVKTWKREPYRFCVPIKYGYNGPYSYITQSNAYDFHLAADCNPIVRDMRTEK